MAQKSIKTKYFAGGLLILCREMQGKMDFICRGKRKIRMEAIAILKKVDMAFVLNIL